MTATDIEALFADDDDERQAAHDGLAKLATGERSRLEAALVTKLGALRQAVEQANPDEDDMDALAEPLGRGCAALLALGADAALAPYLGHRERAVRAAVAKSLAGSGDPRARRVLVALLGDEAESVAEAARDALDGRPGADALAPLVAAARRLESPMSRASYFAPIGRASATAAGKARDEAVRYLASEIDADDDYHAVSALEALVAAGPAAAAVQSELARVAASDSMRKRLGARAVLAHVGVDVGKNLEALLVAAAAKNADESATARTCLRAIYAAALPTFVAMLTDPKPALRRAASGMLASPTRAARAPLDPILAALGDAEAAVRENLVFALRHYEEDAARLEAPLRRLLDDGAEDVRAAARTVLGQLGFEVAPAPKADKGAKTKGKKG